MRSVFILVIFISSILGSAATACGIAEAEGVARRFFGVHRDFAWQETPGLRKIVTPPFYRALKAHYRCAAKEGICQLDYDPWLGAQDGGISGPVSFAVSSKAHNEAAVTLSYQFDAGADAPRKKQDVVLHLRAAASPQCWQVADLVTPAGASIVRQIRGEP